VTTDIKDWQAAFNVNFFSLVTMLQATTPALRESKGIKCNLKLTERIQCAGIQYQAV
jgi:NAD(P)-dependent dehydrogenase (short-subunit alcohol dehydrogenase family)